MDDGGDVSEDLDSSTMRRLDVFAMVQVGKLCQQSDKNAFVKCLDVFGGLIEKYSTPETIGDWYKQHANLVKGLGTAILYEHLELETSDLPNSINEFVIPRNIKVPMFKEELNGIFSKYEINDPTHLSSLRRTKREFFSLIDGKTLHVPDVWDHLQLENYLEDGFKLLQVFLHGLTAELPPPRLFAGGLPGGKSSAGPVAVGSAVKPIASSSATKPAAAAAAAAAAKPAASSTSSSNKALAAASAAAAVAVAVAGGGRGAGAASAATATHKSAAKSRESFEAAPSSGKSPVASGGGKDERNDRGSWEKYVAVQSGGKSTFLPPSPSRPPSAHAPGKVASAVNKLKTNAEKNDPLKAVIGGSSKNNKRYRDQDDDDDDEEDEEEVKTQAQRPKSTNNVKSFTNNTSKGEKVSGSDMDDEDEDDEDDGNSAVNRMRQLKKPTEQQKFPPTLGRGGAAGGGHASSAASAAAKASKSNVNGNGRGNVSAKRRADDDEDIDEELDETNKSTNVSKDQKKPAIRNGRVPGKRIPWSLEEEHVLTVLHEKYYGSVGIWASILADEDALILRDNGRTNIDLKDKWRNMEKKKARLE